MNKSSIDRKKAIELRLEKHGIHDYKIKYLPYLDFDPDAFASPFDVGCRIMILSAASYASQGEEHRLGLIGWLEDEGIWGHVSPQERLLFEGEVTDKNALAGFSWGMETAYALAWSLGLVSELSDGSQPMTDKQYEEFSTNVPLIGDDLKSFLSNLQYIDKTTIIDENLFNELATTYFRDLYFNGNENKSDIEKAVSFERHKALNWVRRFMEIEEWDEVDTST
jgi:hypothetical protein